MNTLKLSLRMKLSDFIDTEYESQIETKLQYISENVQPILLYLWYDPEEHDITSKMKSFTKRWTGNASYKTVIRPTVIHSMREFIWFDIVDIIHQHSCGNYRFQYIYNNISEIMTGIKDFSDAAKFCLSPKPTKKQKRND